MTAPVIAQAKAALNKNLAVTQSKLAKRTAERDDALAKIQAAEDRAELAERSARDITRELAKARTENGRLRAIVRVNLMRSCGATHADIDAILDPPSLAVSPSQSGDK